jgi:hypothetical protein
MNNAIYKAKQRAERHYSNGELRPKKHSEKQVLTCGEHQMNIVNRKEILINTFIYNSQNKQNETKLR